MFALKALITGKLSDSKKKILIRALLQKSSPERSANYGCTCYGNKRQRQRVDDCRCWIRSSQDLGQIKISPFNKEVNQHCTTVSCLATFFGVFYRKIDPPIPPILSYAWVYQRFIKILQSAQIESRGQCLSLLG